MARPKTADPTNQTLSVRFPKDVLKQCRLWAAQEDRSLNEQLLHIVKSWLTAQGRKPSPGDIPLEAQAPPRQPSRKRRASSTPAG